MRLIMKNWRNFRAKAINESKEEPFQDLSSPTEDERLPDKGGLFDRWAGEHSIGFVVIYNPFWRRNDLTGEKLYISGMGLVAPPAIVVRGNTPGGLRAQILEWAAEEGRTDLSDDSVAVAALDRDIEKIWNVARRDETLNAIANGIGPELPAGSSQDLNYTFMVQADEALSCWISYYRDGRPYPGGSKNYLQAGGAVGPGVDGAKIAVSDGRTPHPKEVTQNFGETVDDYLTLRDP